MKKMLFFVICFYLSSMSSAIAQRTFPVFSKRVITDTLRLTKKLFVADMDQDGYMDIVASASNRTSDTSNVLWFENDGNQNFTHHSISDTFFTARSVWVADIVDDGYPDVIAGGAGSISLILFVNDGDPTDGGWVSKVVSVPDCTIYSINAVDFNNDDEIDIIASYANGDNDTGGDNIKFFMNNGDTSFVSDTLVENYESAVSVFIDDFDQDGEWDILSAAWGENEPPGEWGVNDDVSWWENDGTESFTQNSLTLGATTRTPFFVSSADMNQDGYPDALAAIYVGDYDGDGIGHLVYWENDGSGSFGGEQRLLNDFSSARSVHGVDMDGDGDTDILGAADTDNIILWLENDGALGFTADTIITNFNYAYFSLSVDLDGDGDMDVIGSAQNDYEISWFENDQQEDSLIAAGDAAPATFWDGNLVMDFSAGTADTTTVFYNAGNVPDKQKLDAGVHHVALKGFYTLTTKKSSYTTSIDFYYDGLIEWSNIDNESQLVICVWDETNNYWTEAGTGQAVDDIDKHITVSGISSELIPFSRWTLGSSNEDNPLPVSLLSFLVIPQKNNIDLQWRTAAEINNLGYEIWRAEGDPENFISIAAYTTDENLRGQINSSSGAEYLYRDFDVQNGKKYFYQLKQHDSDGSVTLIAEKNIDFTGELPKRFALYQNYPNPFNQSTMISFNIPAQNEAVLVDLKLDIYNTLGQKVRSLINSAMISGEYRILWDGKNDSDVDLPSATYFLLLRSRNTLISKKMILIR